MISIEFKLNITNNWLTDYINPITMPLSNRKTNDSILVLKPILRLLIN